MARPDPKSLQDSTWQPPPLRKWRIKFFASLCLFGFMFGLMLGKLLKPDQSQPPRLLQVQEQADGLQLCFSRLPVAAVLDEKGAFVMLFAVEQAEEQQGRLLLAGGESVSWRLSPRSDGMQLGVVSVQALQGSWSRDADQSSCIRVSLTVPQQQ